MTLTQLCGAVCFSVCVIAGTHCSQVQLLLVRCAKNVGAVRRPAASLPFGVGSGASRRRPWAAPPGSLAGERRMVHSAPGFSQALLCQFWCGRG